MNLPTIIPEPYRLLSRVLVVALVLLALYATGRHHGAEHVRGQWAQERAGQAAAALAAEQAARQRVILMNERIRKAESNAEMRQNENIRLAGDAAATAGRLRNELSAARGRLSAATAAACRETAGAALELLGTCADEYRAVAAAADGHASDVKTLSDAWPE